VRPEVVRTREAPRPEAPRAQALRGAGPAPGSAPGPSLETARAAAPTTEVLVPAARPAGPGPCRGETTGPRREASRAQGPGERAAPPRGPAPGGATRGRTPERRG